MSTERNGLKKDTIPFYKSIFRFIYLIAPSLVSFSLIFIAEYFIASDKLKQKVELIIWLILAIVFIHGWYRSNLAIFFYSQEESFSKANYLSGQEVRFKCSYLPFIGFLFKKRE